MAAKEKEIWEGVRQAQEVADHFGWRILGTGKVGDGARFFAGDPAVRNLHRNGMEVEAGEDADPYRVSFEVNGFGMEALLSAVRSKSAVRVIDEDRMTRAGIWFLKTRIANARAPGKSSPSVFLVDDASVVVASRYPPNLPRRNRWLVDDFLCQLVHVSDDGALLGFVKPWSCAPLVAAVAHFNACSFLEGSPS